ncbi:MAG TPA: PAS domain S-box protein [Gemmatimonadaceae bacterium]|nr:PAS domain S-box protein [Gemmatimonadaceae bacterium]
MTAELTRAAVDEALRRHSLVFSTIGDGVLVMDLDGRIIDMNPGAERLFGYTKEELLGHQVETLHHPGQQGSQERIIQAALRRDGRWAGELHFQRKDGSDGIADVVVVAQCDEHGVPNAWIGVNRDITARRRAEAWLVEQRALLTALVNAAPVAIVAVDAEERVTIWNPAAERLFGWSAAEVLGKQLPLGEPFDSDEYRPIRDRLRSGQSVTGLETRRARKDGSSVDVLLSCAPFRDAQADLSGAIALYQDLTEYRRLEEQLRQSQKMEAIGQLAGGVAHDFNNLLTVIKAYSGIIADQMDDANPLKVDVGEIQRAAGRASSLTQQLLAFSRKQVLQPGVLDLNSVSRELEPMVRRLIGDDVQVVLRLDDTIGKVTADRSQVEQVLINLIVNARDAMPGGGTVSIETANVELSDGYSRLRPVVVPGKYVMIAVSDTGEGMDEETQSRIFEPFFTTKPAGKGTGLGLSTVYGIVKQSSGYIWVYSEPRIGTTFKVYLPMMEAEEISVAVAERAVRKPMLGSETVLLVEDEPSVRSIARRILERNGYTVLEAHDGRHALRVADQYRQPIQLLLTDMMMPELTGRDLWRSLAPRRSELRVLYMSGYTNDDMVRRGLIDANSAFVQKPFTAADLARAVRSTLDTAS